MNDPDIRGLGVGDDEHGEGGAARRRLAKHDEAQPSWRRPRVLAVAVAVIAVACVAIGLLLATMLDHGPRSAAGVPSEETVVYRTIANLLEAGPNAQQPSHGAQMCFGVRDSAPPICSGPTVAEWSWEPGPNAITWDAAADTTWGEYLLTGTYEGGVFTLTEPPRSPTESDRRNMLHLTAGARREPGLTPARVNTIQHAVTAALVGANRRPLPEPGLISVHADDDQVVNVDVILDREGRLQTAMDVRYGAGWVRIWSMLTPVTDWRS